MHHQSGRDPEDGRRDMSTPRGSRQPESGKLHVQGGHGGDPGVGG